MKGKGKIMEKMTQRNAIAFVLENCEMPTDVREKIESIKTSLDKKATKSSADRKPTATQIANTKYKEVILNSMEPTRLYTITEMVKEFDFGEELTNQRVSAIVRQLKESALVERIEDKRKAYFRLV